MFFFKLKEKLWFYFYSKKLLPDKNYELFEKKIHKIHPKFDNLKDFDCYVMPRLETDL